MTIIFLLLVELSHPANQQQVGACHRSRQRGGAEAGRADAPHGPVLRQPGQRSRLPAGRRQHRARVRTDCRGSTHGASRGRQGLVHGIHGGTDTNTDAAFGPEYNIGDGTSNSTVSNRRRIENKK